jgi:hypothetical protein
MSTTNVHNFLPRNTKSLKQHTHAHEKNTNWQRQLIKLTNNQNPAIHLRGARDHILDVISVSGTVDMSVVTILCLVLDVTGVDGDLPCLLLRRTVDVLVAHCGTPSLLGQDLGDCLGEGGLAVIDVADGADVDVGLVSYEFVPSGGEGTALSRRQDQAPGGSVDEGGEGGGAHDWACRCWANSSPLFKMFERAEEM